MVLVKVIASAACGLENVGGIKTIEIGDAAVLRKEIENSSKKMSKIALRARFV